MMENNELNHPQAILDNILENYKPVPENIKPDITMTTSEVWERVNNVIPGKFNKSQIAIALKEKGFTIVDETESFNPEWGFLIVK